MPPKTVKRCDRAAMGIVGHPLLGGGVGVIKRIYIPPHKGWPLPDFAAVRVRPVPASAGEPALRVVLANGALLGVPGPPPTEVAG
jgi:hypothetical protein